MAKRPSKKQQQVKLHKSFKRSYKEDYVRELKVPGIMAHIAKTFKTIFKNWKIFLPLLIIVIFLNVIFVGIMNEATYRQFQDIFDETSESVTGEKDINNIAKAGLLLISTITTGGLNSNMSEVQGVFAVILGLILWLVTIFVLRHFFAGNKIKLRDALYNAGAPIVSTFIIFAIAFLECIPIFIFIIAYSTAMATDFLATPFYALIFFIFAFVMFLLSGYLLSSSLMALVAVTVPGLYPMKAMRAVSDLMAGRRIKFMIRLVALVFTVAIMWAIIMMPLILFDMWMKTFEWTTGIPFVPLCLVTMSVFTIIFITTYLYIYYRWMLDYDEE